VNQVPTYMIKGVEALIAGLPANHQARVIDALRKGPRITTRELATMCNVHRCTVWSWVKSGRIPKPRRDGHRARSWDYREVSNVI
jgi:predicted DNA-binding transcriptional regulator AlpA